MSAAMQVLPGMQPFQKARDCPLMRFALLLQDAVRRGWGGSSIVEWCRPWADPAVPVAGLQQAAAA